MNKSFTNVVSVCVCVYAFRHKWDDILCFRKFINLKIDFFLFYIVRFGLNDSHLCILMSIPPWYWGCKLCVFYFIFFFGIGHDLLQIFLIKHKHFTFSDIRLETKLSVSRFWFSSFHFHLTLQNGVTGESWKKTIA